MPNLPKISLFGVDITSAKEDEILEYLLKSLENGREKIFVVTPNPEFIMFAQSHPTFKKILNSAEISLADGIGVPISASILGMGKIPRVTGTDLLEKLCSKLSKSAYSTGLFGAQRGIAELAAERLQKKYSGLRVEYASDTWDEAKLNNKKVDVLFVALGFPKQEEWIFEHKNKIPAKIIMGVGGAFDYISGNVPRAPKFFRSIGLEWLYRLIIQPWRWKRQLALLNFSLLTIKTFFASKT